ncbi:MAG: DNA-binding protein WhiA [Oscillospiraceae bacterium]|jgi:DNA-binding protein WhiA|nr:DNA-binding protein WhiA [Oscillospiraceae bacterium]
MSFASETKTELLQASQAQAVCCAEAQLYGSLLFGHTFSAGEISLRTENRAYAEALCEQLHTMALVNTQFTQTGRKWGLAIPRAEDRLRVLQRFGHGPGDLNLRIAEENFNCESCRRAFLRGVFLSCAVVSAPERHYHLEFCVGYKKLALALAALLEALELPTKLCQRRGVWLAYYKDSAQMEDVLTTLGAQHAVLELIHIKIEKDMRNNVNRQVNFELANMGRVSGAAAAQLLAIKKLRACGALAALPAPLQEAARLREENPDVSLRELCDLAAAPTTRSGMNHRLKKLEALAGEGPEIESE